MFKARESQLNILFQQSEFLTIYNIFVAVFLMLSVQTLYYDIAEKGEFTIDFSLIAWCFGQLSVTSVTWFLMFTQVLVLYPMFRSWVFNPKASNLLYLFLYGCYMLFLLAWPCAVIFAYKLPPASSLVITCEQVLVIIH